MRRGIFCAMLYELHVKGFISYGYATGVDEDVFEISKVNKRTALGE